MPHSVTDVPLGGNHVSQYLMKLMNKYVENGYPIDDKVIREMKHKLSYVAEDFDSEMKKASSSGEMENNFELPDTQVITVGYERFNCSELLFNPNIIDKNTKNEAIDKIIYKAIMKCDVDIRRELYQNIALAGGNTLFPGMDNRLIKQLTKLAPKSIKIKVIAPPDRKYLAWLGGSVYASLSTFEDMWITKDEYDEIGPGMVHRKCF